MFAFDAEGAQVRTTVRVELVDGERERLEAMSRSRTLEGRLMLQAQIVSPAAQGLSNPVALRSSLAHGGRLEVECMRCARARFLLFLGSPGSVARPQH